MEGSGDITRQPEGENIPPWRCASMNRSIHPIAPRTSPPTSAPSEPGSVSVLRFPSLVEPSEPAEGYSRLATVFIFVFMLLTLLLYCCHCPDDLRAAVTFPVSSGASSASVRLLSSSRAVWRWASVRSAPLWTASFLRRSLSLLARFALARFAAFKDAMCPWGRSDSRSPFLPVAPHRQCHFPTHS